MLYSEFIKKPRNCPFCEKSNPIIKEDKFSYITIATAPYHRHHLMVVPKRHIEKIFDATEEENIEMLQKSIKHILTDKKYAQYLIKNARETFYKNHNIKDNIKVFYSLIS